MKVSSLEVNNILTKELQNAKFAFPCEIITEYRTNIWVVYLELEIVPEVCKVLNKTYQTCLELTFPNDYPANAPTINHRCHILHDITSKNLTMLSSSTFQHLIEQAYYIIIDTLLDQANTQLIQKISDLFHNLDFTNNNIECYNTENDNIKSDDIKSDNTKLTSCNPNKYLIQHLKEAIYPFPCEIIPSYKFSTHKFIIHAKIIVESSVCDVLKYPYKTIITINFKDSYPFSAPTIIINDPIIHPLITSKTVNLCDYSPMMMVSSLISNVYCIILEALTMKENIMLVNNINNIGVIF